MSVQDFGALPGKIRTKLATRIRNIDFSVRTHDALKRSQIEFVGDLVQHTEAQLLRFWGLGAKSLREIISYLAPDLTLGTNLCGWSHDIAAAVERDSREGKLDDQTGSPSKDDGPRVQSVLSALQSLSDPIKILLVTRIKDVEFSVRTRNALLNAGYIFLGDLIQCTRAQLLGIHGFGIKCLREVDRVLAPNLIGNVTVKGWTRDIAFALEEELREVVLAQKKAAFANSMAGGSPIESLNDELRHLAVAYSSNKRQIDIVLCLYGWDGSGAKTLEAVGQTFGITRERVRQISANFLKRLSRAQLDLKWLEKASETILDMIPATESGVETALVAAGVLRTPFPYSAVVSAHEIGRREPPFKSILTNGRRLVVAADQTETPGQILRISRRSVSRIGCCNVDDIADEVARESGERCSPEFVQFVVDAEPGYKLLADGAWFWLSNVPRNRLLNQLNKIFSVSPRISVGELRTAVCRHHRMTGFSPPRRVLASLVAQLPNCKVENEMVTCSLPPAPSDVLSPLELLFFDVFRDLGPVLPLSVLERTLLDKGMNSTSFYIYLSNSPIIARPRTAMYALTGAPIPPGLLEDHCLRPVQKKVSLGSGWCKGGEAWLAYRLTYSNLSSGSFGIPNALMDLLQGVYVIRSEDGQDFGNATVRNTFLYGISKFFTRRGGEPDDLLVLVINLQHKTVTALLGDMDLVERFERGEDFSGRQMLDEIHDTDQTVTEPMGVQPN